MTPDGNLPVLSVNTEEEAKRLIVMACPRDTDGNYYARELSEEQTLENLAMFSDKLQTYWDIWQSMKAR